MAKRTSLAEQLNEAVETIMANPNAPLPAADPRLTELLQIAADLRHLPKRRQDAKGPIEICTPQAWRPLSGQLILETGQREVSREKR